MGNFVVRIGLTAVALAYLCPLIEGFAFKGAFFPHALVYALLFALGAWVVNVVARAYALTAGIKTRGYGILALTPIWLVGWWLLPSATLMLFAYWFPSQLSIAGWLPAFFSGMVLLFINALTSGIGSQKPCGC